MARRKRVLDDGDDSDSPGSEDDRDFDLENDPDAREERALFENPYQNKRRKTNGKEDALYGIFAESSEDEGTNGRTSKVRSKRSDWAKAPTFTSSDKPVKLDDPMPVDDDDQQKDDDASGEEFEGDAGEDEEVEDEDEVEEQSNHSESSRAPSPPVRVGFAFGNKQGIGQKFGRESNPSPRPVSHCLLQNLHILAKKRFRVRLAHAFLQRWVGRNWVGCCRGRYSDAYRANSGHRRRVSHSKALGKGQNSQRWKQKDAVKPLVAMKMKILRSLGERQRRISNPHIRVFIDDKDLQGSGGDGYKNYWIDNKTGAIVIVRADGYVGMISSLDKISDIEIYFSSFAISRDISKI